MRLRRRSYPHPVLGNADDVPGAHFQAAFDVTSDATGYSIAVRVDCNSKRAKKLIATRAGRHALHVECSNTMFRQAYEFGTLEHQVQIPAGLLNDVVELNVFLRATKEIPAYRIEGSHRDYGAATFPIRRGDILAVAEGITFFAENSEDALRLIGSIMQVEKSKEPNDHPMRVDYNGEKIRVFLFESDFTLYAKLRGVPQAKGQLIGTVVFPVLVDVLSAIRADPGPYQGLRWFEKLSHRLASLGLDRGTEPLQAAQIVLEMPVRRNFQSADALCQAAGGKE